MNNCERYRHLLVGLLDRELDPKESAEVNEHLMRCPECREEYEKLREYRRKAVLDLARDIPVVNDIFKIVKSGKVPLIQRDYSDRCGVCCADLLCTVRIFYKRQRKFLG